jgi:hypothetical protein
MAQTKGGTVIHRNTILLAGVFLLFPSAAALGFQVNTSTAGEQQVTSVAVDAAGDFIIVWDDYDGGGDDPEVMARRYDTAGTPIGAPFRVNPDAAGAQRDGAVSAAPDGGFVVAWRESAPVPPDTNGTSIRARRYDSVGVPAGTAFTVNTYAPGDQTYPAIAHDASGNFTIAWVSDGQDGDGTGVFAQRFDAAGTPVGAEFQVNTYTAANQSPNQAPAIAAAPDGTVIIVWYSAGQDDGNVSVSGGGVYAQRYDSSGAALGPEFRVNEMTAGAQGVNGIDVATDALGNFVVAWNESQEGLVQYLPGGNVAARRFDNSGTPLGGDFIVNSKIPQQQYLPAIAMDGAGNFLVSYVGQDRQGKGILAQSFRSDGTRIGDEIRINIDANGDQDWDVAAGNPNGQFLVAWDGDDGDQSGVFARRFNTAMPSCPALPQAGCLDAGRSVLQLGQSGGGTLLWKWKGGPAFDEGDLGNPASGLTAFAFCVYRDDGMTTDLLVDAPIDAAGTCGGRPCWKSSRTQKTFTYKDKAGTASGLTKMRLRSGPAGHGKISVKGGGPSLGLSLPVGSFSSVTAQMRNGNGECWQAEYDAARVNSARLFTAATN